MYSQKSLDLLTKEELKKISDEMNIYYSNSGKKQALIDGILRFIENGEKAFEHIYRILKPNYFSHPLMQFIKYEPTNNIILEHGNLSNLKVADLKGILKYYSQIHSSITLGGVKSELVSRIKDIIDCNTSLGNKVLSSCVKNYINYQKFKDPSFNGEHLEKLIVTDLFVKDSIEELNGKIDYYLEKIDEMNEKILKYNGKIQKYENKISDLEISEKISISGSIPTEKQDEHNYGYVYLLYHKKDTKIGCSFYKSEEILKKSLHTRYHTSLGFDKFDEFNFRCKKYENARDIEKKMHVKYSDLRVNNSEWFSINIDAVEWIN